MDNTLDQVARFLRQELEISDELIPVILHQCGESPNRLPVVLWQHQLINLTQLDQLCEWLERHVATACEQQVDNQLHSDQCLSMPTAA